MQPGRHDIFTAGNASAALEAAARTLDQDYWAKGFTYQPSPKNEAKLLYRAAMFARLAKTLTPQEAETMIEAALEL